MSKFQLGDSLSCDLQTLIDTRLLVQANSGGGKSWCLRRILEQTHGKVQHLVIDPEGEFASLRERFDYVLAAKQGGDTAADPRSAPLLAERLLELGVSAILDIYELKHHERIRFVKVFLEALVNAPKRLWHPALIVLDEAHVFCPQQGEAESAGAVIDLATRGRKRGFCLVPATQRMAKLHKDAAAECNNKLIGRTGQDVDVKRAADELGFPKERWRELRELDAGEFFAFGPALSRNVVAVKVGAIQTTHPKAGSRQSFVAPPMTEKIRALLPKLSDLPAEVEAREKTEADLKRENANLRRELTVAQKAHPATVAPQRVEVPIIQVETLDLLRVSIERLEEFHNAQAEAFSQVLSAAVAIRTDLRKVAQQPARPAMSRPVKPAQAPQQSRRPTARSDEDVTLGKCERAILSALAQHDEGCSSGKLTLLTRYRYSGGFKNSLSALRQAGYMTGENTGLMQITDEGREAVGEVEPLPIGSDLGAYWLHHPSFGKCEQAILGALLENPEGLTAAQLCDLTNYAYSGGFKNSLSSLRTAGVIVGRNTDVMKASDELFD